MRAAARPRNARILEFATVGSRWPAHTTNRRAATWAAGGRKPRTAPSAELAPPARSLWGEHEMDAWGESRKPLGSAPMSKSLNPLGVGGPTAQQLPGHEAKDGKGASCLPCLGRTVRRLTPLAQARLRYDLGSIQSCRPLSLAPTPRRAGRCGPARVRAPRVRRASAAPWPSAIIGPGRPPRLARAPP
jgi:hypothetical protein